MGGYKFFTPDVLSAADVNEFLMQQSIMRFASSAVRANTLTAPVEGMITYLEDTNLLQVYDGSAWVGLKTSALESTGGLTVDTSSLRVDATNDHDGNALNWSIQRLVGGHRFRACSHRRAEKWWYGWYHVWHWYTDSKLVQPSIVYRS
jgi:hypothetical protein